MRNGSAILTLIGVMFGHSFIAVAQTDGPRTMFDLFEQPRHREVVIEPQATRRNSKAQQAPSKASSMFDLLQAPRRTSTAGVNNEGRARDLSSTQPSKKSTLLLIKPPLPRQRPRLSTSETAALARERIRLRSIAAGLQQKPQVQKAEAGRLDALSSQLKQARESLSNQKRELQLLRQSLNSNQLTGPAGPQDQRRMLTAKETRPATGAFNGPEERSPTRLARIDPPPLSTHAGKANLDGSKCKRAKALVEGYAFANVEARTCEGNSYLFSATRDKSTFSIRVDPQTWELTEVAKVAQKATRR